MLSVCGIRREVALGNVEEKLVDSGLPMMMKRVQAQRKAWEKLAEQMAQSSVLVCPTWGQYCQQDDALVNGGISYNLAHQVGQFIARVEAEAANEAVVAVEKECLARKASLLKKERREKRDAFFKAKADKKSAKAVAAVKAEMDALDRKVKKFERQQEMAGVRGAPTEVAQVPRDGHNLLKMAKVIFKEEKVSLPTQRAIQGWHKTWMRERLRAHEHQADAKKLFLASQRQDHSCDSDTCHWCKIIGMKKELIRRANRATEQAEEARSKIYAFVLRYVHKARALERKDVFLQVWLKLKGFTHKCDVSGTYIRESMPRSKKRACNRIAGAYLERGNTDEALSRIGNRFALLTRDDDGFDKSLEDELLPMPRTIRQRRVEENSRGKRHLPCKAKRVKAEKQSAALGVAAAWRALPKSQRKAEFKKLKPSERSAILSLKDGKWSDPTSSWVEVCRKASDIRDIRIQRALEKASKVKLPVKVEKTFKEKVQETKNLQYTLLKEERQAARQKKFEDWQAIKAARQKAWEDRQRARHEAWEKAKLARDKARGERAEMLQKLRAERLEAFLKFRKEREEAKQLQRARAYAKRVVSVRPKSEDAVALQKARIEIARIKRESGVEINNSLRIIKSLPRAEQQPAKKVEFISDHFKTELSPVLEKELNEKISKWTEMKTAWKPIECKLLEVKATPPDPKPRRSKAGVRHTHKCVKCQIEYAHVHKQNGEHAQSEFQCPNRNCEWFFRKGNEEQQSNKTRSRFLTARNVPIPKEWSSEPQVNDEWAFICSDTWHNSPAGFCGEVYGVQWRSEGSYNKITNLKLAAAHTQGASSWNDLITDQHLPKVKKGDTLQVPTEKGLVNVVVYSDLLHQGQKFPGFFYDGNLVSGTPIFRDGRLVSVITFSSKSRVYGVAYSHKQSVQYGRFSFRKLLTAIATIALIATSSALPIAEKDVQVPLSVFGQVIFRCIKIQAGIGVGDHGFARITVGNPIFVDGYRECARKDPFTCIQERVEAYEVWKQKAPDAGCTFEEVAAGKCREFIPPSVEDFCGVVRVDNDKYDHNMVLFGRERIVSNGKLYVTMTAMDRVLSDLNRTDSCDQGCYRYENDLKYLVNSIYGEYKEKAESMLNKVRELMKSSNITPINFDEHEPLPYVCWKSESGDSTLYECMDRKNCFPQTYTNFMNLEKIIGCVAGKFSKLTLVNDAVQMVTIDSELHKFADRIIDACHARFGCRVSVAPMIDLWRDSKLIKAKDSELPGSLYRDLDCHARVTIGIYAYFAEACIDDMLHKFANTPSCKISLDYKPTTLNEYERDIAILGGHLARCNQTQVTLDYYRGFNFISSNKDFQVFSEVTSRQLDNNVIMIDAKIRELQNKEVIFKEKLGNYLKYTEEYNSLVEKVLSRYRSQVASLPEGDPRKTLVWAEPALNDGYEVKDGDNVEVDVVSLETIRKIDEAQKKQKTGFHSNVTVFAPERFACASKIFSSVTNNNICWIYNDIMACAENDRTLTMLGTSWTTKLATCVCDVFQGFYQGHWQFHLSEDGCDENYKNCHLIRKGCTAGNATFEHAPKSEGVLRPINYWLIAALCIDVIFSFYLFIKMGPGASLGWIFSCFILFYAVESCHINGHYYEAKQDGNTKVWRVYGHWREGDCFHTDTSSFTVVKVATEITFQYEANLIAHVDYEMASDYGCPGGQGESVCNNQTLLPCGNATQFNLCTSSYNEAYHGTSCFWAGTLTMETTICAKYRTNYALYDFNAVTKQYLVLQEDCQNCGDINLLTVGEGIDSQGFSVEHLSFGHYKKPLAMIMDEDSDKAYAVVSEDMLRDVCTCTNKDHCVPKETWCSQPNLKQSGPTLSVSFETPTWLASLGSPKIPLINEKDRRYLGMVTKNTHATGYIVVPGDFKDTVAKGCTKTEPTSYKVSAALAGNYNTTSVIATFKETGCLLNVNCSSCTIVSPKRMVVQDDGTVSIELLCGWYSSTTCSFAGDGDYSLGTTFEGLTVNYKYLFDRLFYKTKLILHDSVVEKMVSGAKVYGDKVADVFSSWFHFSIGWVFKILVAIACCWMSMILASRGNYVGAVVLMILAFIPYAFAEPTSERVAVEQATSIAHRPESYFIMMIICVLAVLFSTPVPLAIILFIKDDIFASMIAIACDLQRGLSDGLEYFRSDYEIVRTRSNSIENALLCCVFFVSIKFAVIFFVIKFYRQIYNLVMCLSTKTMPTEIDSVSFISDKVATWWPKHEMEVAPERIIFHHKDGAIRSATAVIDSVRHIPDNEINIEVMGDNDKRIFYVSKIDGLLIMPRHAIDENTENLTGFNDVLIHGDPMKALKFINNHIGRCAHAASFRKKWCKGESGLIVGLGNQFYMHAGLLKEGLTPVCCICSTEFEYYQADNEPSTSADAERRAILRAAKARFGMKAENLRKFRVPSNEEKAALTKFEKLDPTKQLKELNKEGAVGLVNTKYGVLPRVNGVTPREFKDLSIAATDTVPDVATLQKKSNQINRLYQARVQDKHHAFTKRMDDLLGEKVKVHVGGNIYDEMIKVLRKSGRFQQALDECVEFRIQNGYMEKGSKPPISEKEREQFVIATEKLMKAKGLVDIENKIMVVTQAVGKTSLSVSLDRNKVAVIKKSGEKAIPRNLLLNFQRINSRVDKHILDEEPGDDIPSCSNVDPKLLRLYEITEKYENFLSKVAPGESGASDFEADLFICWGLDVGIPTFEGQAKIQPHSKLFITEEDIEWLIHYYEFWAPFHFEKVLEGLQLCPRRKEHFSNSKGLSPEDWFIDILKPYADIPRVKNVLVAFEAVKIDSEETTGQPSSEAPVITDANMNVADNSYICEQSDEDFIERLQELVTARTQFNQFVPIKTDPKTGTITDALTIGEHWMNESKSTHIMKIMGSVQGYCYVYEGVAYTSTHVIRRGSIVVNYWGDMSGLRIVEKMQGSDLFTVKLQNRISHSESNGDVTVFPISKSAIELANPQPGEIHVYIDHHNKRWGTLRCTGSTTMSGSDCRFYSFHHVDITHKEILHIPYQTHLKGVSGTPIFNRCGQPVGTWGLSCKAEYADDNIETTLVKADLSIAGQRKLLEIASSDLIDQYEKARNQRKILRVLAPTGAGKSTKLILEAMMALQEKQRVPIAATVLIPTRDSSDRLYEYMSQYIATSNRYAEVEIRLQHGKTIGNYITTWNNLNRPAKVVVKYQTYGSAAANYDKLVEADVIWVDEVHTRSNSQVLAILTILKMSKRLNVIALTATPFKDSDYVDYRIPGKSPYTVTDDSFGKWCEDKATTHVKVHVTSRGDYALPREALSAAGRKIIFFPTKDDCAHAATELKNELGVHTAVITSERNDNLENDSIICATDAIESSATIPNVNRVFDTMLCNRPDTQLTVEKTGITYLHQMQYKTIDTCQKQQRRGRTGRTCTGTYYSPSGVVPEALDQFPMAACWEAALILCSIERIDTIIEYQGEESDHPVYNCWKKIEPRAVMTHSASFPSSEYGFSSLTEQQEKLIARARLCGRYNYIPSLGLYLTPVIPQVLIDYEHYFQSDPSLGSICDTWPAIRKVRNDEFHNELTRMKCFFSCNEFFNVLTMSVGAKLEEDGEKAFKELFLPSIKRSPKVEEVPISESTNKYSWINMPTAIALSAVGIGLLGFQQVKQMEYGDRKVDSVLRIPVDLKGNAFACLANYEYNDLRYHEIRSRKITNVAKRIYTYGKNRLIDAIVLVAKVYGDKELEDRVVSYFLTSRYSDTNWLVLIQEYVDKFLNVVNKVDLTKYENLGLMAAFPAIAAFFQASCTRYGEWFTTIMTSIFSVLACDTLGLQSYGLLAGSTLLLNLIKSCFTLKFDDVDYSPNLALSMIALPAATYIVRKLAGDHSAMISKSIQDQKIVVQQTLAAPAVATAGNAMLTGSGGADTGYAFALRLCDLYRNGMGSTTGDKVSSVLDALIRCWNAKNMTGTGFVVAGITMCVDVVVNRAIDFVHERSNEIGANVRIGDIGTRANNLEETIRNKHTQFIRDVYQIVKIAVGGVVNPFNIPFIIISTALKVVKMRSNNIPVQTRAVLDMVEQTTMTCPLITCVQTAMITFNISSEASAWAQNVVSVGNIGSALLRMHPRQTATNCDETLFTSVCRIISEKVLGFWNAFKDGIASLNINMVTSVLMNIVNAMKRLLHNIMQAIRGVGDSITETARNVVLDVFKCNWILNWLLSSPRVLDPKKVVQLEEVTTVNALLYHLDKYGLSSISSYLEKRVSQDIESQLFRPWFPRVNFADYKLFNLLIELKVNANPRDLATFTDQLKRRFLVSANTRIVMMTYEDAYDHLIHFLGSTYWTTFQQPDKALRASPITPNEIDAANYVSATVVKRDLVVSYFNKETRVWFIFFFPMVKDNSSKVYAITNDAAIYPSPHFQDDAYRKMLNELLSRKTINVNKHNLFTKVSRSPIAYIASVLAHTVPNTVLFEKWSVILEMLTKRSIVDFYISKFKIVEDVVKAILMTLGVTEFKYTRNLTHCRVPESELKKWMDVEVVKDFKVDTNTCAMFSHWNELISCHKKGLGFETLFVRCMREFNDASLTVTLLNIITGKSIYYYVDEKRTIVSHAYNTCNKHCFVYIKDGYYYERLDCGGARVPKITHELLEEVTDLRLYSLNDISKDKAVYTVDKLAYELAPPPTSYKIERGPSIEGMRKWHGDRLIKSAFFLPPCNLSYLKVFLDLTNDQVLEPREYIPYDVIVEGNIYYDHNPCGAEWVWKEEKRDCKAIIQTLIKAGEIAESEYHVICHTLKTTYPVQGLHAFAIADMHPEAFGFNVHFSKETIFTMKMYRAMNIQISLDAAAVVRAISEIPSYVAKVKALTATYRPTNLVACETSMDDCIDIEGIIRTEYVSVFARLPNADRDVILKLGDKAHDKAPRYTINCIVGDQNQLAAALGIFKGSRKYMSKRQIDLFKKMQVGAFDSPRIAKIDYVGVPVAAAAELPAIDHRRCPQYNRKIEPTDDIGILKTLDEEMEETVPILTDAMASSSPNVRQKFFSVLTKFTPTKLKEKLRTLAKEELKTDVQVSVTELDPNKLSMNSKLSMFSQIANYMFGNNSLVDKHIVRNYGVTEEYRDLSNKEFLIHQKLTKPVADAIAHATPVDVTHPSFGTLGSIVHFDSISHRRLANAYDDKLRKCIEPTEKERFPQGPAIIPLTEATPLPEPLSFNQYLDEKLTRELDGMATGHVWDVMKRWNRVYLPDNETLGSVSLGYAKANQIDRDTALFYTSNNILDLSAGAGGFIHYKASVSAKDRCNYVFTTLSRPTHVNVSLDPLYAAVNKADGGKMSIRKLTFSNGDFRYQKIFDLAKETGIKFDLLVSDCGEASSNLELESAWLSRAHPIMDKSEKLLSKIPINAMLEYLSLVRTGGSFIIKLMGYRTPTRNVVKELSKHFSKLLAYKMPSSSYQSREWYLVCMGKRDKCGEVWPNLDKWLDHVYALWIQKFTAYYNWVRSNHKLFAKDLKNNGPDGFGLGLTSRKRTQADILKEVDHPDAHFHSCIKCGKDYVHMHQHRYPNHPQTEFQCPNAGCVWYWGRKPGSRVELYVGDVSQETTCKSKMVVLTEGEIRKETPRWNYIRRKYHLRECLAYDQPSSTRVYDTTDNSNVFVFVWTPSKQYAMRQSKELYQLLERYKVLRIALNGLENSLLTTKDILTVLRNLPTRVIFECYVPEKQFSELKKIILGNKVKNDTNSRLVDLDAFNSRTETKKRPIVPVFSYFWKKPDNTWIKLGPTEIQDKLNEQALLYKDQKIPFPKAWTRFGHTFYPDMDRRWSMLKELIEEKGYHVNPPTQKFEKIYEVGKISFKEKYGNEKHTANMVINDLCFEIFGLTPETSVIGHTQCTEEHIRAAHKKRLDLDPIEPNDTDAAILLAASTANCTPEYWKIANGPEHLKFKPWSYEETCLNINNQGAGGHFDKWQKFKDAVADPEFRKQVEKRYDDLLHGRPCPAYQTCRDKRETKAKKCINADAELVVPEELDVYNKKYLNLNSVDKKQRREARRAFLKESSRISPRNIRYAEFVQRFVDLMIYGPYQKHHNDKEKMYMGSTTGTPLWKMGDLMRGIYEVYSRLDEKEFLEGDKIIENNRKHFSKEFLSEFDKRNIKIQLMSDVHARDVLRAIELASKSLIASGDFSGWDGTLNNTDHVIELIHHERVYQKQYHELLKNRMTIYMFSFTITDLGNVLAGRGQRGSGDQLTSSGNTFHNDNLHTGSTATALGLTCEEVSKPIAIVHYRVDFGDNAKWKKYYVRRISHTADGDDNNHFGTEEDIRNIDRTGIRFIERCGKKIRCGTRAGYDIASSFDGLNFCSHSFIRVRKQARDSLLPYINTTLLSSGERPKRLGDMPDEKDPNVILTRQMVAKHFGNSQVNSERWTLIHQRIYDGLNDLIVTYLPKRPLPEIIGKLNYTIKNDVISFSFNRFYGNDVKSKRLALKNERAFDITRGKALAYLLNYVHIESVRILVCSIMSVIGDGTCDLTDLKKRFNVPSSTDSLNSAIKSVFNVRNINQIETIAREYDRKGLNSMRRNAKQVFESCKVITDTVEWAICPTDPVTLLTRCRQWSQRFCETKQIKPDPYWFALLSEDRGQPLTEKTKPKRKAAPSSLITWIQNMLALTLIRPTKIIGLSLDLSEADLIGKRIEVPQLKRLILSSQVYRPHVGDRVNIEDDRGNKIMVLFLNKRSGDRVYARFVNNILQEIRQLTGTYKIVVDGSFKRANLDKVNFQGFKLC